MLSATCVGNSMKIKTLVAALLIFGPWIFLIYSMFVASDAFGFGVYILVLPVTAISIIGIFLYLHLDGKKYNSLPPQQVPVIYRASTAKIYIILGCVTTAAIFFYIAPHFFGKELVEGSIWQYRDSTGITPHLRAKFFYLVPALLFIIGFGKVLIARLKSR